MGASREVSPLTRPITMEHLLTMDQYFLTSHFYPASLSSVVSNRNQLQVKRKKAYHLKAMV